MSVQFCGLAVAVGVFACPAALRAEEALSTSQPLVEQALEDAWWTGPMLASGAGTLPQGHWLVEPYLFNVHSKGGDSQGSLTYVLYGLTDRITVGAIPTFSYNQPNGTRNSSHVGVGDLTLQGQYRMTQFRKGRWVPTTSLVLQETLPTGKYDRLDGRSANGFGGGAYATTVGYYVQSYHWAPNGRIVRLRLDTSATLSRATKVRDDSAYGTPAGFRGRAKPGASLLVDAAMEYSVTRNWVLALDLVYRHDEPTKVSGVGPDGDLMRFDTGVHDGFAVAPAVEYNVSPSVGVLVGMRVIPATGGRRSSVTPAVALNMVY
jgi:hypothetical protein